MVVRLNNPFGPVVDQVGVGDFIAVFYVSELGSPSRVVGTCIDKLRGFGRFNVITVAGVVYSFDYRSPNIVAIKRLLCA